MDYNVFIGIDVSKETLDFAVWLDNQHLTSYKINNDRKSVSELLKKLSSTLNLPTECWLFCLEHTGIYCYPVLECLKAKGHSVWLENASKIIAFHALQRGKNDELDAIRIAQYACYKQHSVVLWEPPRQEIMKLKSLLKLRDRLLVTRKRLKAPLKEEKDMKAGSWTIEHARLVDPILKKVDLQLAKLEKQIEMCIHQDETLNHLFSLMTSVRGVGMVVAANVLVVTNEFKTISDPRKMACQSGVAPFSYESGKSIKGRAKVSHRASKPMKALLNMAARSAVSSQGELQDYYLRKVGQGKNKMLVLNAVRNKIIHRIYACVRDNRKYEKSYTHSFG